MYIIYTQLYNNIMYDIANMSENPCKLYSFCIFCESTSPNVSVAMGLFHKKCSTGRRSWPKGGERSAKCLWTLRHPGCLRSNLEHPMGWDLGLQLGWHPMGVPTNVNYELWNIMNTLKIFQTSAGKGMFIGGSEREPVNPLLPPGESPASVVDCRLHGSWRWSPGVGWPNDLGWAGMLLNKKEKKLCSCMFMLGFMAFLYHFIGSTTQLGKNREVWDLGL